MCHFLSPIHYERRDHYVFPVPFRVLSSCSPCESQLNHLLFSSQPPCCLDMWTSLMFLSPMSFLHACSCSLSTMVFHLVQANAQPQSSVPEQIARIEAERQSVSRTLDVSTAYILVNRTEILMNGLFLMPLYCCSAHISIVASLPDIRYPPKYSSIG